MGCLLTELRRGRAERREAVQQPHVSERGLPGSLGSSRQERRPKRPRKAGTVTCLAWSYPRLHCTAEEWCQDVVILLNKVLLKHPRRFISWGYLAVWAGRSLWRGRAGSVCSHMQQLLRCARRACWNAIPTKSKDSMPVDVKRIRCLLMAEKKTRHSLIVIHHHFENSHCCLSALFSP